ncbi:hypothetical protein PsorP6_007447 [Peronosclerospora sorghi]|uniref:Uncharacterized protein n=1 Tax=Peronosclerospora sorghi TaxID=230839 RepID=A0ACC0W9X4_9STRA|nr:hypothetical protein PsorP6_007447 [Peronosclerospora sorghi]
MTLEGNVEILTPYEDESLVTDVTLLSISEGSDVVETVASSSDAKKNPFDAVVSFNEETEKLNQKLNAVLPLLKAGGVLQMHVANVQ